MKLTLAHLKTDVVELLREPAYLIPSLVFPSLFFLFFVVPNAKTPETTAVMLTGYLIFATFGVAFFQFGVGVAQDRVSPWSTYLRSLPLSPLVRVASRIAVALVYALAAGAVLVVVAYLTTPVQLGAEAWLRLVAALLVGAIPASLMGITLGYWVAPKAAVPVANLFYLPMAFLGGLWVPPQFLPEWLQPLSRLLPTRQWGELAWPAALGEPWSVGPWLALALFTLVFGFTAMLGFRRDEGRRFS